MHEGPFQRLITAVHYEYRFGAYLRTLPTRGEPLVSYKAIVQLIAATTTRLRLNVRSEIDAAIYPPRP
jgi:hypothetical protein